MQYRQFLLHLGKNAGELLFRGADTGYELLKVLKTRARKLVSADNEELSLPEDAFVFLMYHGTRFYFFPTNDRVDDPPVYFFVELDSEFTKEADHLSEWFKAQLTQIKRLIEVKKKPVA